MKNIWLPVLFIFSLLFFSSNDYFIIHMACICLLIFFNVAFITFLLPTPFRELELNLIKKNSKKAPERSAIYGEVAFFSLFIICGIVVALRGELLLSSLLFLFSLFGMAVTREMYLAEKEHWSKI